MNLFWRRIARQQRQQEYEQQFLMTLHQQTRLHEFTALVARLRVVQFVAIVIQGIVDFQPNVVAQI